MPRLHGGRLNKNASYIRINGQNISDIVKKPIDELADWFASLPLSPNEAKIAERPLEEIRNRLRFMQEVGLGYLTLDRQALPYREVKANASISLLRSAVADRFAIYP